MATKQNHTWEDLESVVGQDFSDGQIHWAIEPVEWTSIRRYCEAIESDFPLFHDRDSAIRNGYRDIICPSSHIQNHTTLGLWSPGDPTRWPNADRNYTNSGGLKVVKLLCLLPTPQQVSPLTGKWNTLNLYILEII